MSFDIFLQPFAAEPLGADRAEAVRAILEPLVDQRGNAWVRIVTIDGSAEVHGYGDDLVGLMVNHASGGEVWNVLHGVADAGGFAVMPVGCGTFVTGDGALADLPDGVPEPVVVVNSGAEMQAAVEAS